MKNVTRKRVFMVTLVALMLVISFFLGTLFVERNLGEIEEGKTITLGMADWEVTVDVMYCMADITYRTQTEDPFKVDWHEKTIPVTQEMLAELYGQ
jgi:hypothetical protein